VIGVETEPESDSKKDVRKAKRLGKKEVKEESVKHLAPVNAGTPKSTTVDNGTPISDLTAVSQNKEDKTDKENSDEVNMDAEEFVEDATQPSAPSEPKTKLERDGVEREEAEEWVDKVIGYGIGMKS